MSRVIDVTNGDQEYVVARVVEVNKKDLATATFEVALSVNRPTVWQAADLVTFPSTGTALVSLMVDDVAQIGDDMWLWVRTTDATEILTRRGPNDHVTVV